ncbi:MAG: PAS domain S-box protein, partial [Alphaproteobacteria bacterium]|nr:PAS domain S-box protein [Alphaproteobacteria bacterium]
WIPNKQGAFLSDDIYLFSAQKHEIQRYRNFLTKNALSRDLLQEASAEGGIFVKRISFPLAGPEEQSVLAVLVPVFQRIDTLSRPPPLAGGVLSLINGTFFFDTILADPEPKRIEIFLSDRSTGEDVSLFRHEGQDAGLKESMADRLLLSLVEPEKRFSMTETIPFGNVSLKVAVSPSYMQVRNAIGWTPWMLFLLGLTITAVVAFWFYQQISRNIEIRKIVAEQTRALTLSERYLRAVLSNTADGILTTDDKGMIETFNDACERLFGYRAEEIVGENISMLMPSSHGRKHDGYIEGYMKTGVSKIIGVGREVEGLRKDGSTFPLYISVGEFHIGTRHTFVGIIHDITEDRNAQRTRNLLASIVESSDDAIISTDLEGTISSWNLGAKLLFGHRTSEALGKNVRMIIPSNLTEEEAEIMASLSAGKRIKHYETVRIDKDGNLLDVSMTVSPLRDGEDKIVGASMVVRNITERKRAEAELMKYTMQLKQSNQELDDFVYIISHDLKEPVRGLYSYSQFMAEDYADRLEIEGVDKLETLKKLSLRMEELIESLLYYSRLGRSELAFGRTDMNEVLAKTLDLMEPEMKAGNVTIQVQGPLPHVVCDSVRVGEIFRNLIVNAIKYNDSEEKNVEIGCTTDHEKYPGREVFYVADNGIGIEEKYRETIFKMFKRLHARGAYGGGTGSGLTIVQKIVDRHGGIIWVESRKGEGSTFYFMLEKP